LKEHKEEYYLCNAGQDATTIPRNAIHATRRLERYQGMTKDKKMENSGSKISNLTPSQGIASTILFM
jgi:hypothetical protein